MFLHVRTSEKIKEGQIQRVAVMAARYFLICSLALK